MSYSQAQYEAQVREFLQDTGTTNNNRMVEDLTIQVVGGNGSRTVFTLSRTNVQTTSALPALDVNQTGFSKGWVSSVDTVNGILTTSSAPQLSTSVPTYVQALYYFQHFTDAEIDEFVNFGLGQVESTAPMTGANATTSYQGLSSAQFNVVCLFATAMGYYSLSNRYAQMVNASAEGKNLGKGSIAQRYLELSDKYLAFAEDERKMIYGPRQGKSTVASSVLSGQGGQRNLNSFNRAQYFGGFR